MSGSAWVFCSCSALLLRRFLGRGYEAEFPLIAAFRFAGPALKSFQQFYNDNPDFKAALLDRVRRGEAAQEAYALSRESPEVLERMQAMRNAIGAKQVPNPTRASAAIDNFAESKGSAAENTKRTLDDKRRLLDALFKYLASTYPDLGADPFVHRVQTFHIDSYTSSTRVRQHQGDTAAIGSTPKVSAATALKKLSDLRSFFSLNRPVF